MAKDKFITSMDPIGEFNAYVDKPIINEGPGIRAKNTLTTLAKATQLGVTAYDNYKDNEVKTEVGDKVMDEIDLYKNTSQSWNNLPFVKDEKNETAINENELVLSNELGKIDNAVKKEENALAQGKITPFQSQMRIKQILQDSIRNNPARADVITKYSAELLKNAGMNIIYAEDEALARAAASDMSVQTKNYQNYVISEAKKHNTGLVYIPGTKQIDYAATEVEFQDEQVTLNKKDAIKYKNEIVEGEEDVALEYVVKKGWDTSLLAGVAQDIRTKGLELFPEDEDPTISAQKFPQRINTLLTYIDQQEYDLMTRSEPKTGKTFGSLMDNPEIKVKFELFGKQLTNYKNRIRSWRDGSDAKLGLENVVASKKALSFAELYEYVSAAEIQQLENLTKAYQALGDEGQGGPGGLQLQNQIAAIVVQMEGGYNSLNMKRNFKTNDMFYNKGAKGIIPFVQITNGLLEELSNPDISTPQKNSNRNALPKYLNGVGKTYLNVDNEQLTNKAAFKTFDHLTNIVLNEDNEQEMSRINKSTTVEGKELSVYGNSVNERVSQAVVDNLMKVNQDVLPFNAIQMVRTEDNKLVAEFKNINDFPKEVQADAKLGLDNINRLFDYINKQFDYYKWYNNTPNADFNKFAKEFYPQLPNLQQ